MGRAGLGDVRGSFIELRQQVAKVLLGVHCNVSTPEHRDYRAVQGYESHFRLIWLGLRFHSIRELYAPTTVRQVYEHAAILAAVQSYSTSFPCITPWKVKDYACSLGE